MMALLLFLMMMMLMMMLMMISLGLSPTRRVDGETTRRQAQRNPTGK